jgi:hypothetical protein
MSIDPRERNRLANQYTQEEEAKSIGSPFRTKLYVDARIAGKSRVQALSIARGKLSTKKRSK